MFIRLQTKAWGVVFCSFLAVVGPVWLQIEQVVYTTT